MEFFLQVLTAGLAEGAVHGLVALGVVVIFTSTRLLNFAQGEFVMLGGLAAWLGLTAWGLSYPIVVLAVLLVGLVSGAVVEVAVVGPLRRRGVGIIEQIISTLGVAIFVAQGARLLLGAMTRPVPAPFGGPAIRLGGVIISRQPLIILVSSLVAVAVFGLIRSRTRFGLSIRAVGANRIGAEACGLNVRRIEVGAWMLSGAIAAIAGLLVTPIRGFLPLMGLEVAIFGFIAAILGGIANPYAAYMGGILLGIASSMIDAYMPSEFAFSTPALFVLLIVVVLLRPEGLIPSAETQEGALRA